MSDTISTGVAPSAMRMPISRVRAVAKYAIMPYPPTAERTSASAAKAPTSHAISRGREALLKEIRLHRDKLTIAATYG